MKYAATFQHTDQVGFDQSQTFTEVLGLTGSESVAMVMQWANRWVKDPNVIIVQSNQPLEPTPEHNVFEWPKDSG
jgi:hypothetical protein